MKQIFRSAITPAKLTLRANHFKFLQRHDLFDDVKGRRTVLDLARILFEPPLNPNLHRPVSHLGTNGVLAAAASLPLLIPNRDAILKSLRLDCRT